MDCLTRRDEEEIINERLHYIRTVQHKLAIVQKLCGDEQVMGFAACHVTGRELKADYEVMVVDS